MTVIDWNDEYVSLMQELDGVVAVPPTTTTEPGAGEISLSWNLLDPRSYSPDVTPDDYVQILVQLLTTRGLIYLPERMKEAFKEALTLAYQERTIPTLGNVVNLVGQVSIPFCQATVLRRKLRDFSDSCGSIFCNDTSLEPIQMFERPMTVRVRHLAWDNKFPAVGLLAFLLLRQAIDYFRRMGKLESKSPVRHVTVIEEAPYVLGSSPKLEEEGDQILLQAARKVGESVVFICKSAHINKHFLRESNQIIAYNLDTTPLPFANLVGERLGLSREDRRCLRGLPRGIALARMAGNRKTLVKVKADNLG